MAFEIDMTGAAVLVTGVSSGIGQGIARQFARAGATVIGCARRDAESDGAQRFRSVVEGCGARAFYVQCDISERDAPDELVGRAVRFATRLDCVVSNAGRNVFTGVDGSTIDDWNECMDLDLRAHWLLAKAAAPELSAAAAERPGDSGVPSFLVNSSNHAYTTIPGCFPYNVAKAGLTAFVQALAIEWGPRMRAVGVAPGYVETEGARAWFAEHEDPAETRRAVEALHPVGRMGNVDEIGAIFLFLASRYADFISGTTILADGGRGALMQDGDKDFSRGS